ncbi:MAG: tyrosine--tRNA ligase [Chloroflexi bacterium]|nr:tyrosine--tRNA ligase [Chloroflexota bacterium]|tara:strand:- start:5057 stop:6343 length:1287 start_codon:yes stop_codon:yes gene_type:complete
MPNFKNIIEELEWRNALKDFTTGADTELINGKITCYNGFDPTAKSLHIGNLIPILGLQRLQKYGHSPIVIIGGGTGMIGDPSGRSDERKLLSPEKIEENLQGIKSQLEKFLDFESKKNPARIINNATWLSKINLIDFLRDTGKFFNINNMMSKDSVKNRLSRDEGISFTEFSYQLLQAYDFLYLFKEYNCTFQMGGSDQWGNIVAGVDLIRKISSKNKAHGITYPLLTTSSGEKFGKSIDGAVTLDSEVTIPYKLFQYFFNSSDDEVLDYIKLFTDINQKDFEELTSVTIKEPFKREAQIYLAKEITHLVHGKKGLDDALRQTEGLNKGNWQVLTTNDYEDLYKNSDKSSNLQRSKIKEGITIQKLTVDFDLCKSLGESKRLISQGGISINGNKILDPEKNVSDKDLKANKIIILSKGKKTHKIITVD